MWGIHVTRTGLNGRRSRPIHTALTLDASQYGCSAAQIFVLNPRSSAEVKLEQTAIFSVSKDIQLYAHASYATHLNESRLIIRQLELCAKMGIKGLNVHLPLDEPQTIAAALVPHLPHCERLGVQILLENISSKSKHAHTPAMLEAICKAIVTASGGGSGSDDDARWGLCVDTAHLWACGVDVSTPKMMQDCLDHMPVATSKIKLFHLNGATSRLGAGSDRHAIPGCPDDLIFGTAPLNKTGFWTVVQHAKKHGQSIILEINRGTDAELEAIAGVMRAALN